MLPRHESLTLTIQCVICLALLLVSPTWAGLAALAVVGRIVWITRWR